MNHSELIYRLGNSSEVLQMQQLGLISYGQHAAVLGESWKTMEANLQREQMWTKLLETSTAFVCEHNGKLVGMAFLIPNGNPDDIYLSEWCYIRMVGVLPDYSGKGIARELTKMCINKAKESGEKTIALHTSEFMNAARHIYESLGFNVLKEIPPRFGKKYWVYAMEL